LKPSQHAYLHTNQGQLLTGQLLSRHLHACMHTCTHVHTYADTSETLTMSLLQQSLHGVFCCFRHLSVAWLCSCVVQLTVNA